MKDFDVVVVGGGISGLVVADGLIEAGLTVKVFEARAEVGGRMATVAVPGGHADLGATWFWPGERRIAALVDRLELATHQQWSTGDALVSAHGQLRRVSWGAAPAWRFSEGAATVPAALADQLPTGTVATGCVVQRIESTDTGVLVHLGDTRVSARCAVVALPPSLALGAGLIPDEALDPDLAMVASTIPVWMGATAKAVAVYPNAFWRTAGLSGLATATDGPLHEIHDMSGPNGQPAMLFGFGQAGPGRSEITQAAITDQLTGLFGPEAATPLEILIRDWQLEEHTTSPHHRASQRYDLFSSPLLQRPAWAGRLYWASTETSSEAPGHIEGALTAAERTIHAIAWHLGQANADAIPQAKLHRIEPKV